MDTIASRVAHRFAQVASHNVEALTFPREFHLPKEVRDTPATQPPGTDLYIWVWDSPGPDQVMKPYGICFQGKSNKPLWHHRFSSPESRQRLITETVHNRKAYLERKEKEQQARKDFTHGIQVGEIYYTSWGYDQTNVDFYEVLEIRGKDIIIREVAQKIESEQAGADYVVAVKGHYVGGPVRVRPTGTAGSAASFKVDGHHASKWDGKPKYKTAFGWGH